MSGYAENDKRGSFVELERTRGLAERSFVCGVMGKLDERKQTNPILIKRVGKGRQHVRNRALHMLECKVFLWTKGKALPTIG